MADSSAPSLSDLSLWKIKSDKCSGKINFTAQENCPLVARVPAIDKTGKEWQDTVREEERQSFIRVVKLHVVQQEDHHTHSRILE